MKPPKHEPIGGSIGAGSVMFNGFAGETGRFPPVLLQALN